MLIRFVKLKKRKEKRRPSKCAFCDSRDPGLASSSWANSEWEPRLVGKGKVRLCSAETPLCSLTCRAGHMLPWSAYLPLNVSFQIRMDSGPKLPWSCLKRQCDLDRRTESASETRKLGTDHSKSPPSAWIFWRKGATGSGHRCSDAHAPATGTPARSRG